MKISASSRVGSQSEPGWLARPGHQPAPLRSAGYWSPSANRNRSSAAGFVATSVADAGRFAAPPTSASADAATSPASVRPSRSAVRQHALFVPAPQVVLFEVEARGLQRDRLPLLAADRAHDGT